MPPAATRRLARWLGRALLFAIARLPLLLAALWGGAALWIDGPSARPLAAGLAGAFLIVSLALILAVRPWRRGALRFAILFVALLAWWLSLEPSNDRRWMADVAELPRAVIDGDLVTIHNIRDFAYRTETDHDARWVTSTYDLTAVTALDLFLCYWEPREIAHTVMSWEFSDGRRLAISIETRKEADEEYSAVRGFFRQFELYYVVAEERDVIGVRAGPRGEDVFLYRLRTPPDRARRLLLQYLERIERLAAEPAWYNAFTQNCTTVIFDHVRPIVGSIPFDLRILRNGRLDEMLHEQGIINAALPFEELRARSHVSAEAREAGRADDFSVRIRQGLPERPPPPP